MKWLSSARRQARRAAIAITAAVIVTLPAIAQPPDFLEGIPPYLPKSPVTGELRLAGSSTMNQLAHLWVDGLKAVHPEAKVSIQMIGSEDVPGLLDRDEADVGLMSRALTEEELGGEAAKYTPLPVAKDVVCFVVHPDNPLDNLSLDQLKSIFAPANGVKASTWGDLGATGERAKLPVKLYGRSDRSGIRGYLATRFGGADGLPAAQECAGYSELCQEIAKDQSGIGYVSLSLCPPGLAKIIGIVDESGQVHEAPRVDAPIDAAYPLVRQLFLVLKGDGQQNDTPLRTELLQYVLSRQGQGDAIRAGLLPLRRDEILMSRDQLGWTGNR